MIIMIRIDIDYYNLGAHGKAIVNNDVFTFSIRDKRYRGCYLSFSQANDIIFTQLGYDSAYDFCEQHHITTPSPGGGIWPYCNSLEDLHNFVDDLNKVFSKLYCSSINIF